MATTVLTNAVIIDCTGADPRPGWAVIEDNRIKEVGHGAPGALPAKAVKIDCKGQTLLPGLIEGHMHVASVDASIVNQQRGMQASYIVIKSMQMLKDTLDQGFTTARDCGGIDAGYRRAVAEGLVPGARLFVSGSVISILPSRTRRASARPSPMA
jgi:imidazolonepropionase-like amidohydrolase